MDRVVTSAGDTRYLIAFELIHHWRMDFIFKRSRASMAMQALAIVERLIQMDRIHWRCQVLDVNVPKSMQLNPDGAVHRVVRVAGVACLVGRNAMILKMGGRDMVHVVNVKASAVRLHDVTGKAKVRLL